MWVFIAREKRGTISDLNMTFYSVETLASSPAIANSKKAPGTPHVQTHGCFFS